MTPTESMSAFHGDAGLKAALLDRLDGYRAAGAVCQGRFEMGGEDADNAAGFRADAAGCTLRALQSFGLHELWIPGPTRTATIDPSFRPYESVLGVPRAFSSVQNTIFNRLESARAQAWPGASWAAVPVGAGLSLATSRLLLWALADPEHGVAGQCARNAARLRADKNRNARLYEIRRDAVEAVAALYRRRLAGDEPPPDTWTPAYTRAMQTAETCRDGVHDLPAMLAAVTPRASSTVAGSSRRDFRRRQSVVAPPDDVHAAAFGAEAAHAMHLAAQLAGGASSNLFLRDRHNAAVEASARTLGYAASAASYDAACRAASGLADGPVSSDPRASRVAASLGENTYLLSEAGAVAPAAVADVAAACAAARRDWYAACADALLAILADCPVPDEYPSRGR